MNDARIIEELGISGITICPALNEVQNKDRILVEFRQSVRTPFKFDDADRRATAGKLIGTHGEYLGSMQHRFSVYSVQDAWPEIVRRARAYQETEKDLAG